MYLKTAFLFLFKINFRKKILKRAQFLSKQKALIKTNSSELLLFSDRLNYCHLSCTLLILCSAMQQQYLFRPRVLKINYAPVQDRCCLLKGEIKKRGS